MDAYTRLAQGRHHDPFQWLGLHPEGTQWRLRTWLPGARTVTLAPPHGPEVPLQETRPGLFEALLERRPEAAAVRLRATDGQGGEWEEGCPWVFPPLLGELDLHLIHEGRHQELWKVLGARRRATSTTGTDATIPCRLAAQAACGNSSCPACAPVTPTSTRSRAATAT
jgi:1,4-alpha-glucan branching enzyme